MDHVKVEVQVELINSLQQIRRHLNHSLLNTLRVFLCKLSFCNIVSLFFKELIQITSQLNLHLQLKQLEGQTNTFMGNQKTLHEHQWRVCLTNRKTNRQNR